MYSTSWIHSLQLPLGYYRHSTSETLVANSSQFLKKSSQLPCKVLQSLSCVIKGKKDTAVWRGPVIPCLTSCFLSSGDRCFQILEIFLLQSYFSACWATCPVHSVCAVVQPYSLLALFSMQFLMTCKVQRAACICRSDIISPSSQVSYFSSFMLSLFLNTKQLSTSTILGNPKSGNLEILLDYTNQGPVTSSHKLDSATPRYLEQLFPNLSVWIYPFWSGVQTLHSTCPKGGATAVLCSVTWYSLRFWK